MGDEAKLPNKPQKRSPVDPRPVGKEKGTEPIEKANRDNSLNPEVISK